MPKVSLPLVAFSAISTVIACNTWKAAGGTKCARSDSRLFRSSLLCEANRPNRVRVNNSRGKRASRKLKASPEERPTRSSSWIPRTTRLVSCHKVRLPSFQIDSSLCRVCRSEGVIKNSLEECWHFSAQAREIRAWLKLRRELRDPP